MVPPSDLKTCTAPPIAPIAQNWFVGVWQLFKGGGGAYAQNRVTRTWKVIGLDVAGTPPIGIRTEGSYEWVTDSKSTVRGKWRSAAQSELKYGYDKRGTTILLERGEDGANWLVSRNLVVTADGQDKILIERVDLGLSSSGGRMPGTRATAVTSVETATAAPASVKRPSGPAAPMLQTVVLGKGAVDYDSSKWTAEVSGGTYKLAHESGKGLSTFTTLADARSARAAAEVAMEALRQNLLKFELDNWEMSKVRGVEAVIMRMTGAVHGVPYIYLVGVMGNGGGGLQLSNNATAKDYAGLQADFAALIGGLRLN